LLDARRTAEAQGRLDFTAEVKYAGSGTPVEVTARLWMGLPHTIRRINFVGHTAINDSTLRRALTVRERDVLNVAELRRSLERINDIGLFEPVTLADIAEVHHHGDMTADLTISLRQQKRRWWSVSGPVLPGIRSLRASIASRLPPWGRGIFEAMTYFVSINVVGVQTPFVALERPLMPGQMLLSGFTVSPTLSPQEMLMHYGRTHVARAVRAVLGSDALDPLAVPVTLEGRRQDEPLVCVPPKPRLWRLREGASIAANVSLAALVF
jgi:hypothetical protein